MNKLIAIVTAVSLFLINCDSKHTSQSHGGSGGVGGSEQSSGMAGNSSAGGESGNSGAGGAAPVSSK